jgi:hypothetical protein
MSENTDILGTPLTDAEQRLMAAYRTLEALATEDLSPTANANIAEALASLWQVVNNLGLTSDRPSV